MKRVSNYESESRRQLGDYVKRHGIKALAARLGIDDTGVHHYIAGRSQPSLQVAILLEEIAGIPCTGWRLASTVERPATAGITAEAAAALARLAEGASVDQLRVRRQLVRRGWAMQDGGKLQLTALGERARTEVAA